ncbi:MAG TPA: hypothetical protein VGA70_01225 [Longimicrobiales bacterium]|jgi:protein kinase/serine/threonine-protein kinase
MWFRRLVREFHRRSIWQVGSVFIAGSWVALQVVETLTESAGLPQWFPAFALGLLVLGFPFVLVTAFMQEGLGGPDDGGAAGVAAPRSALHDLFTWRNAALGGVCAAGLAAVVAFLWLGGGGSPLLSDGPETRARRSVAVLPFTLVGTREADDEAFAYGMHDELLTRLSQLGGLRVTSRTSVMRYASSPASIPEIGEELGVEAILEGGIQRSGGRVRINVQLIDAATDEHLWAETYERDFRDVFALQSELTQAVAQRLRATLSPEEAERLDERPTDDLAAYEMVLEAGRLSPQNAAENEAAIGLYRRAVERDPDYASALSGLAWGYAYRVSAHGHPPAWLDSALVLVARAHAADPAHPSAWNTEGFVHQIRGAAVEARRAYRRGLELAPSSTAMLTNLAALDILHGRVAEGYPLAWRAVLVDPGNGFPWFYLALGELALDRMERARAFLERALGEDPDHFWALRHVAFGFLEDAGMEEAALERLRSTDPTGVATLQGEALHHLRRGRAAEAAAGARRLVGIEGRTVWGGGLPYGAIVLARAGHAEEARPHLEAARSEVEAVLGHTIVPGATALELAAVLLALGEREEGLAVLRRGVADGNIWPSYLRFSPLLDTDEPAILELHAEAERIAAEAAVRADAAVAELDPLPGMPGMHR